jgi:serine phosphatase RsbU (regulator of sigma subunit)
MDVAQILARANRILWETSAGAWWAGMWLGQIKLDEGHCDYATFGRPTGLWLRNTSSPLAPRIQEARRNLPLPLGESRGEGRPANKRTTPSDQNTAWASLIKPTQPLGLEPLTKPEKKRILLAPGDSLVVCNRGIMETSDQRGRSLEESALAHTLLDNLRVPPSQMIDLVRELMQNPVWEPKPQDRSMLVVQRNLR